MMYEGMSFQDILQRMLDRVPDKLRQAGGAA